MNQKLKNNNVEPISCEKYMARLLRQGFAKKSQYQEKVSPLVKQTTPRLKLVNPQPNPGQKVTQSPRNVPELKDCLSPPVRDTKPIQRHRSESRGSCSSTSKKDSQSWGQMLCSNKSNEKISCFSNFDPLRTIHFLSKELQAKLSNTVPNDKEVQQIVSDIQIAVKRIPPEISTLIHIQPNLEYLSYKNSSTVDDKLEKSSQTPPTLYQEDTEKFQKIMEENTYRLEASCKQLEYVCNKLQCEKDITEKELNEAKENVELLCRRVKDLEKEIAEMSEVKIAQLEQEKLKLQKELKKALAEVEDNPVISHLKALVEDLKKQKLSSEQECTKLQYEMTLLQMEKEKFMTLLAVRDGEIKEIQEEMSKIQAQVSKGFQKLSGEVLSRVASIKALSDIYGQSEENKDNCLEIGDSTISSINTNDSFEKDLTLCRETPCGDAAGQKPQEVLQKLIDVKVSNKKEFNMMKSKETDLEGLLKNLTPSCKALIMTSDI